ncbi:MAG: hypothetical protein GW760_08645 [Legionella sp.]|jgi:hypothetical protein|nr:hypothetical protein [Legionella sp.]
MDGLVALKELNAKPIAQTTVCATKLAVPQFKGLLIAKRYCKKYCLLMPHSRELKLTYVNVVLELK